MGAMTTRFLISRLPILIGVRSFIAFLLAAAAKLFV
jgi:hypothetical protein